MHMNFDGYYSMFPNIIFLLDINIFMEYCFSLI